jgi:hypothetical protein
VLDESHGDLRQVGNFLRPICDDDDLAPRGQGLQTCEAAREIIGSPVEGNDDREFYQMFSPKGEGSVDEDACGVTTSPSGTLVATAGVGLLGLIRWNGTSS